MTTFGQRPPSNAWSYAVESDGAVAALAAIRLRLQALGPGHHVYGDFPSLRYYGPNGQEAEIALQTFPEQVIVVTGTEFIFALVESCGLPHQSERPAATAQPCCGSGCPLYK